MDIKKISVYNNDILNTIDKLVFTDTDNIEHTFSNLSVLEVSTTQIHKITDNKYSLNIDDTSFSLLNDSIRFSNYFVQFRPIIFNFSGEFVLKNLEVNYIIYYKGDDAYTNGSIYKYSDGSFKYITPYWHKNEDNSISLIIEVEDFNPGSSVDLTDINNRINTIEQQLGTIATMQSTINNMQTTINTMQTSVNNMQTKVDAIDARMDIINNNIGNSLLNKQVTQEEYDTMKANGTLQDGVMYIII